MDTKDRKSSLFSYRKFQRVISVADLLLSMLLFCVFYVQFVLKICIYQALFYYEMILFFHQLV